MKVAKIASVAARWPRLPYRMAGSSKRVARRVGVKQWRAEALRLRAEGWTVRAIAKKLRKAASTVHEAIEAELAAIPAEGVKQLRQVHGEQLDAIIRGNIKKASGRRAEANAGFVIIAAIGAKAKLFGLYAVEKVDVTAALTLSLDAHQQLLDRLASLAEPAPAEKDETAPG